MKTSKIILWLIVAIVIIGGLVWVFASNDSKQRVAPVENETSFTCENGEVIEAGFADSFGIVNLSLEDGRDITLERILSDSGSRYENETGIVFWTENNKAFVEEGGELIYSNCTKNEGVISGGKDLTIKGVVISVDESQAMVDGPFVIDLMTEGGDDTARIEIPSMGIMLCEARDNIADIGDIKEGMTVEVRGVVNSENVGSITPCESAEHYLRVVSE